MKYPFICLQRKRFGRICVVSRLQATIESIETDKCMMRSSVFPEVCIELQEKTVESYANICLKVDIASLQHSNI